MTPATTTRIAFNRVGDLPAPAGHPAPKLFLLWGEGQGEVVIASVKGPDYKWPPTYSFTPMVSGWTDWSAVGWEDCEFGTATFEASGPDGARYRWEARFSHDGDPRREFWGACFSVPERV